MKVHCDMPDVLIVFTINGIEYCFNFDYLMIMSKFITYMPLFFDE